MKKYYSLLLAIFISFTLTAQNEKDFKTFYKTYKKEKSIIGISAPIGIANLFIDREEKELRKIVKKGKKVRILVFDNVSKKMNSNLKSYFPTKQYQNFMSVKEDGATIDFMVRDNLEFISELIVFVHDGDSLVAMGIYGEFTYNDLKELTDSFQK